LKIAVFEKELNLNAFQLMNRYIRLILDRIEILIIAKAT